MSTSHEHRCWICGQLGHIQRVCPYREYIRQIVDNIVNPINTQLLNSRSTNTLPAAFPNRKLIDQIQKDLNSVKKALGSLSEKIKRLTDQ